MVDLVPGSIQREGKVSHCISVSFVIELEQDTQANVCKDGMHQFREDVIV